MNWFGERWLGDPRDTMAGCEDVAPDLGGCSQPVGLHFIDLSRQLRLVDEGDDLIETATGYGIDGYEQLIESC
ncbi:hypothetical protein [Agrobacterium radiobacter]|uniref:hypothetical protein n=1 Tax=Agrobacterium radiobacter TaxID=362 RepID=UPI003CE48FB2